MANLKQKVYQPYNDPLMPRISKKYQASKSNQRSGIKAGEHVLFPQNRAYTQESLAHSKYTGNSPTNRSYLQGNDSYISPDAK